LRASRDASIQSTPPYLAAAHLSDQPLKTRALDQSRTRAPKVFINHHHILKTQGAGLVRQAVLAARALLMVQDLVGGGLTDIDQGSPTQMING